MAEMKNRQHTLGYFSSYDRGLSFLLFMWPDIKKEIPDAELHIAYGWDLFLKAHHTNPERMRWKESIDQLMQQDGIVHHGRVGKHDLTKLRRLCGVWAYPTSFDEINCITALECQRDGCVPVVINRAALKETVMSGIKVEGDIQTLDVQENYVKELIGLMRDEKRWNEESEKAQKVIEGYDWESIASQWVTVFEEPAPDIKVTVVTPTIREGWWEMMATNLTRQTYKNLEWLILDDHKQDRSKTADKYAEKYDLNIRYIRGDKALGTYKRKHGLARANNIALQESAGDLLVFIQDFIKIPEHGIEWLVNVHRDHPTALIAPVDEYFYTLEPDLKNKEDWWPNMTDIYTKRAWRNVRLTFEGIRETDNASDFEMNYCAIPKVVAEGMNGWYEFFDDQMGYDNTEFAYRALQLGYKIIIDDTNVAKCIEREGENGRANIDPKYWDHFIKSDYPAIRDEKRDTY